MKDMNNGPKSVVGHVVECDKNRPGDLLSQTFDGVEFPL